MRLIHPSKMTLISNKLVHFEARDTCFFFSGVERFPTSRTAGHTFRVSSFHLYRLVRGTGRVHDPRQSSGQFVPHCW